MEILIKMRNDRYNIKSISDRLNLSIWTVHEVIKRQNIERKIDENINKNDYDKSSLVIVAKGYINFAGIGTSPSSYTPYITTGINHLRIGYLATGDAASGRGARIWMNGTSVKTYHIHIPSNITLIPFVGKFFIANGNANNIPYFNNKILGFKVVKNPTNSNLPRTSINTSVSITVPSLPLTAI
jgi:hypothetical protein